MAYVWVVLYLILCFGVLGLHVLSLPANWVVLGLAALWGWLHPDLGLSWGFYGLLGAMAVLGEVLEFASQYVGGKKYGATGKGNLGAFLGALGGALFGAPFFLGLGALLGAVGGAYAGCYLFERMHGRASIEAWRAAKGAMLGRVLGLVIKVGLGVTMVVMTARGIWPQ